MTAEQVQAYLDDLARLSARHGLVLRERRDGMCLEPLGAAFQGYSAVPPAEDAASWAFFTSRLPAGRGVSSLEVGQGAAPGRPDRKDGQR